jgi:hypothetical protein
LDELRTSVESNNAELLERGAHALKGMLRGLAAEVPASLAQRLEQMGSTVKMNQSPIVFSELEAALLILNRELAQFIEEAKAANSLGSLA